MDLDSGRLIFPGGKAEFKRFAKEMNKHLRAWAAEMSSEHRRSGISAWQWAGIADQVIESLIADDTETTMAFILALPRGSDEAYRLALEATQIMYRHGAALYQPGGDGTRDPRSFVNESQDILAARKAVWDEWLAGAAEYRRKHGVDPEPPF